MKTRQVVLTAFAISLAMAAGCSRVGEAQGRVARDSLANAVATNEATAGSRVLAKTDITLRGAPACDIDFVYAGMEPEDLFWEEPCAAVTAEMMTQRDLEALNDWDPLDSFDKQFINAMPGGRVLYVGGSFTASIYPVGTTGVSYEVSVSD